MQGLPIKGGRKPEVRGGCVLSTVTSERAVQLGLGSGAGSPGSALAL